MGKAMLRSQLEIRSAGGVQSPWSSCVHTLGFRGKYSREQSVGGVAWLLLSMEQREWIRQNQPAQRKQNIKTGNSQAFTLVKDDRLCTRGHRGCGQVQPGWELCVDPSRNLPTGARGKQLEVERS